MKHNHFLLSGNVKIGIVGAGGLGKEVLCCLGDIMGWSSLSSQVVFLVEQEHLVSSSVYHIDIRPLDYNVSDFDLIIMAIGDIAARERIVSNFSAETVFFTLVHPGAYITPHTQIGAGSIVLGHAFLSCDVTIGKFSVINPGVTISHDSTTGDFFTAAPGVNVSGNCTIGNRVFLGANVCLRNRVTIKDDITVGMGGVVVKDLIQKGTYIGFPAKLVD